MKKIKEKIISCINKYKIEAIFVAFYIGFIFVFCKYTEIISYKLNWKDDYSKLVEILFENAIGLISIWISAYFILIQLYKNTYPMEVIEKKFLKKVKLILIFSLFVIIIGALTIMWCCNSVAQYIYIVLFFINLFVIFYNTYKINREFKLNTYIDKYLKELSRDLQDKCISEKSVNEKFFDLKKFFNECMVKEEYFICNDIAEKIGVLFRKLIEECSSLLVSDQKEIAEYIFDKIINFSAYQIESIKNSKNTDLISKLFLLQRNNIISCIKIGNFEWFKNYVSKINVLVSDCEEIDNSEIIGYLYYMNTKIGEYLLDVEDDTWMEWILNEIYSIAMMLKVVSNKNNINLYAQFIVYLLRHDLEKNGSKKYKVLKNNFELFTSNMTFINDKIEDLTIHYTVYGGFIMEKEDLLKTKDFIEILTNENNKLISDKKWNEFVLYYLNESLKKWKELSENNRKLIIERIMRLTLNYPNDYYFNYLPDYIEIIEENKNDTITLNNLCDEIEELLIRIVINDNINMFYSVLNMIKNILVNLERKDKDLQIRLFNIYLKCMRRVAFIDNKKYFEIILNYIDEVIEEMDKTKTISNDLADIIINKLTELAGIERVNEKNAIAILTLLIDFLDEKNSYNFMHNHDRKKLLYKKVYNVGMMAIENNLEELLRVVSNALGWFIIWSIKQDNNELIYYIIERTMNLYCIARQMEVTEKTQIFLLTLFTTIGTYCCNNKCRQYEKYLNKIVEFLRKNIEIKQIEVAVNLRTDENDLWDDLYENKTKELTAKFLKKIKKDN